LSRDSKKKTDLLIIAEANERVIGAVFAASRLIIGYIYHLAAHPKYQRRGIGSMLLKAICERLRKKGVLFVFLTIKPRKYGDLDRFYRRHGFRSIGVIYYKRIGRTTVRNFH
jgi:ribosomal protein S18 acetylase RimI-like enzyme